MLTTLLSTLQSSLTPLFPKPYLISSLLPITLFVAASYAMAVSRGGWLRAVAERMNPVAAAGDTNPWNVTIGVLAVFAAAMLWSGAIGLLLEVLEGRHLGWPGRWLHACERERLLDLDRRISTARSSLRALEKPPPGGGPAAHDSFVARLIQARDTGRAVGVRPPGDPPPPLAARWWARFRNRPLPVTASHEMRAVSRVVWRARLGLGNTRDSLAAAVDRLETELEIGTSPVMDQCHADLLIAFDEARERLKFEIQRLLKERQFRFPTAFNASRGASALAVLAPTRFGNVGLTIRSYAVDRYGMDLDIFWGRLQKVLPAHEKTYSTLQDAKTQVDFIVSLFWLTLAFVALWSVTCLWIVPSPGAFLAVTAAGPVLARVLYLSAVQNYMLFADQVRSAVDMHRFELLTQLHVGLPQGNREEIAHWRHLGEWIGYGNDTHVTYTEKP